MPSIPHCLIVLLFISLGWASNSFANMASPYQDGDAVSEPSGGSSAVEIVKEDLRIDLQTLTDSGHAEVRAIYTVRTDRQIELPLLFVARALGLGGSAILLDGQPLRFDQKLADDLPPGWNVPSSLSLDGPNSLRRPRGDGTLKFTLSLTPGEHTISVHYHAIPDSYSGGERTVQWLLSYVLAPARTWKSFGQLQITVISPRDWEFRSNLPLKRSGDILTGSFDGIPADDLSIIVQAPSPSIWLRDVFLLALAAIICCGMYYLGRATGRTLQRKEASALWMAPVNLILGMMCGVIFSIVGFAVLQHNTLGHHFSRHYSSGLTYLFLFLALLLALVTLIVGQIGVVRGKRNEQRSIS